MAYVFISYSKKNRTYARKLADYLLACGFDVWIDDRIDFGTNWEREIFKAIDRCAAFVVIMTPASYASDWVQRERLHAEARRKPPLPLLLEGEVFPFYRPTQYSDVRGGRRPSQAFLQRLASFVPRNQSTRKGRDLAELRQAAAKATPTANLSPDYTQFHVPEGWEAALALRQKSVTPTGIPRRSDLKRAIIALVVTAVVITIVGLGAIINGTNRTDMPTQASAPTEPALTIEVQPLSLSIQPLDTLPLMTPLPSVTPTTIPAMAFFPQSTNVRSGPGTEYSPPIGAFAQGQWAEILAVSSRGDWYKVRFRDGEGWVSRALVETSGDLSTVPRESAPR